MMKRWKLWLVLAIAISGVSMALIYYFTIKPGGIEKLFKIPIYIILLAVTAHVLNLIFWSLRIKILAYSVGEHVSFYRCFKIVMVNLFVAAITPSGMGGEPARIYMLSEGNMSGGDATAVTIGERIIDFIFMGLAIPLFFFMTGMAMNIGEVKIYLYLASGFLGILGLLLVYMLIHAEKIKKKIGRLEFWVKFFVRDDEKREKMMKKLEDEFMQFATSTKNLFSLRKKYLILTFIVTAAMWLVDFTIIPLILIGLGYEPHWLFMFTAQLIIILITIIPISPGGTGLAEFTGYALFSQKVPPEIAGITVILWRALTFYMNLVLGLIYTLSYIAKK